MCGIIGYIGKNSAIPRLLTGLKNLEYRGYDSAGIAYVLNNKVNIVKEKGKISNLEKSINVNDFSCIGIGHTRWATHGVPDKINSHPHRSGNITLVHNGIIENYKELKEFLINNNYSFVSETDSEVACAYIDYEYQKNNDILKAISKSISVFRGSFALGIIVDDDYSTLYATRKDSPLIVGIGDNEHYIASDVPAILDYTNEYILLDNYEIVSLKDDSIVIYDSDLNILDKEIHKYEYSASSKDMAGYDHYMLKEINEQSILINNLIKNYDSIDKLTNNLPDISNYNKVFIVGCGSAYHAGMVGKYLIENYANIEVNVEIASEFRYKKLFIDENTLVIAISQSGETADTLASIRIAKEHKSHTIGIVNVEGSSIAREVDNVIYTKAGIEVAVATTKGYTTQVFILSMLALCTSIRKNIITDSVSIFESLKELPTIMNKFLSRDYSEFSNIICNKEDIFFLGRNIDYALVLEGSLKLKEISYIHSEAYQAGELKHGTISLISDGTPVISLISCSDIYEKTISNVKETKARGSYSIVLSTNNIDIPDDIYDKIIYVDKTHDLFQPLLNVIPLQIIAYNVAKERGLDIDKPRNLAKSVTVE